MTPKYLSKPNKWNGNIKLDKSQSLSDKLKFAKRVTTYQKDDPYRVIHEY